MADANSLPSRLLGSGSTFKATKSYAGEKLGNRGADVDPGRRPLSTYGVHAHNEALVREAQRRAERGMAEKQKKTLTVDIKYGTGTM